QEGHGARRGPAQDVGLAPQGVAERRRPISWPRPVGWGPRLVRLLPYVVVPVVLVLAWEVVGRLGIHRESLLPTPTRVVTVWLGLVAGQSRAAGPYAGTWLAHAAASTWRVLVGFGAAAVLGVGFGLLMGLSPLVEKLFDPTVQLVRNIPVTAWVPLALPFFGSARR